MIDSVYLKLKRIKLPALLRLIMALLTFVVLADSSLPHTIFAQAANGITQPTSGETISGVVTVTGTAVHPDYLRYELAFRNISNPTAEWIVFAEGSEPVSQGTLAVWDTTVGRDVGAPIFPDGLYQLRLRVVRNDYNYDEFFVTDLVIANDSPTPTPTAAAATTPDAATAAPAGDTAVFQQPTPLPSLTPFPTPTQPAALSNPGETAVVTGDAAAAENTGVLDQLAAVDTGQFGRAFWQGVRLAGLVFAALALYLLLRSLFRWGWRQYWRQKNQ
ncbi:MAG: hypothetical protein H6659_19145 [Ardenticatenaceae bacterium]|nr:hypothetical protein [Ardenticatenaceae bacterium]MCB8986555.1 hypothetical protein [Ardenticatenaceae bacterium]